MPINALLCGAGYKLRLILNHLAGLLRALLRWLANDGTGMAPVGYLA